MQENGLNDALMDFGFYEIHDGIKTRALPIKQDQLMENGFVALSYNMVAKEPLMGMRRWIPAVSQPYGDELVKFGGEVAGFYVYKMLMGKPISMGNILLKQLLSQGSQYVVKKI